MGKLSDGMGVIEPLLSHRWSQVGFDTLKHGELHSAVADDAGTTNVQ